MGVQIDQTELVLRGVIGREVGGREEKPGEKKGMGSDDVCKRFNFIFNRKKSLFFRIRSVFPPFSPTRAPAF